MTTTLSRARRKGVRLPNPPVEGIPAAVTANGNFLDEMVRPVGAANRDGQAEQNRQ